MSEASLRPSAGGPPRLNLRLLRRLKLLLLLNTPVMAFLLIGGTWVAVDRQATLRVDPHSLAVRLMIVLAGLVAVAAGAWVLVPVAAFLRDWPTWHYRHGPRPLWLLPLLGGWCAWVVLWLAGLTLALSAAAVVILSIWDLAKL